MESLEGFLRGVINDTLDALYGIGDTIGSAILLGAVLAGAIVGTAIVIAAWMING